MLNSAVKVGRRAAWPLLGILAACGSSNFSPISNSSQPSTGNISSVASIKAAGSNATQPIGTTAAARLLMQATMGASLTDLSAAAADTYDAWFAAQAAAKPSLELPRVPSTGSFYDREQAWWTNAVHGGDQLRQRMAFALSEIFVVSQFGITPSPNMRVQGMANYYDLLTKNALGNFRTLLGAVSLSPVMGNYLTFFKNDVPNPTISKYADENYAREIMQLFTIGLWHLNEDGTQQLDAKGNPITTYTQSDVSNLALVFTGWGSHPVGGDSGEIAWTSDLDVLDPMVCYAMHHDTAAKLIVGGVVIAAGGTCQSDMAIALDTLFNHPNTGPFISKQLIQRLVTSNPSPQYVARVANVFANDGQGVRGNLLAVAKAILTDPEAVTIGTAAGSGKLREPMLRLTALWRAFSAAQGNGAVSDHVLDPPLNDFGENALESPTVFNFFVPTYEPSGPLADAGIAAPEFQITNESTIVLTANDLENQSYKYVSGSGVAQIGIEGGVTPRPTDMLLHTAAWEGYAGDPEVLVNQLDLVFMSGQMPAAMHNTLVSYANAIPATSPASRVIEVTSLMLSAPQYSVQR